LARFDGVRFTMFDIANTPELSAMEVRGLYEDHEGGLWIATYPSGIRRLKDGRFTVIATKEALAGHRARCFREDRAGTFWIGTTNGLTRWKDGALTPFPLTEESGKAVDVTKLVEDRDGDLWIATSRLGLGRLRNGKLTWLTSADGLAQNYVAALLADRDGNL